MQEIHALMSRLDERQPKSRSELLMFFENCKKCKIIDSHNTLSIVVIFTGVSRKYAIKLNMANIQLPITNCSGIKNIHYLE